MLSSISRVFTHLNAILYGALGLSLYFLSERLAPAFAWNVTPLLFTFQKRGTGART